MRRWARPEGSSSSSRSLLSIHPSGIDRIMEAYTSSGKLDLSSANSLLHSVSVSSESSPQSSSNGDIKRKTTQDSSGAGGGGGGGGAGGSNLISSSVASGLTSDLSSLYALENLHHHHHHVSLPHHHPHHGNLIGNTSGISASITSATSSSSQSIQTGAGSLLAAGSALGLPGKSQFVFCWVGFFHSLHWLVPSSGQTRQQ